MTGSSCGCTTRSTSDRSLVAGTRVLRLSPVARQLIVDRTVMVDSRTSALLADRLLDLDLADPVLPDGPAAHITVVIPVKDNASGVERLLTVLVPHLPCIVVDDASAEAGAVADVAYRHGAMLIRLDHNLGPAAARDVGLKQVTTPLVAFVDSDVEVSVESLAALGRHFADPRLAAAAPRVRTRSGARWFERYEASSGSLDLGPRPATVRPWSPVTYVPSACLVGRVDALGAGFDPSLRSGEDVDLVWRLQADGHRVRYIAEVTAHHDARRTVTGWLGRKVFYGTSAAPLARRHGDRAAPAVMTLPVATVSIGLLLQRRWSLAAAAVAAGFFVRDTGAALGDLPARRRRAVVVATGGTMLRQTSGLVLRHWWPASLVLAVASRRGRRALLVAGALDVVAAHRSSDRQRPAPLRARPPGRRHGLRMGRVARRCS
ncbi:mycofactocin biosynthesis glycosyltransferase MftF [Aeromicrobium sp. UC242_57]|uniref:mycofactocin biosynthesis glycosyltransferase MftF n=1 Tax=Aeromicrobium sp. UC242_57 TaxID=3374624 RepID=UPI0037B8A977